MSGRNERKTEELVRARLRADAGWSFEEQSTADPAIRRCLRAGSKQGGKGIGKPEFIAKHPGLADFVVVIECKADPKFHQTTDYGRPKDYACDGALHYAKQLSAEFDVVAIGVSGEYEDELLVSAFVWRKGADTWKRAEDRDGPITSWRTLDRLHACLSYDPQRQALGAAELTQYAKKLHNKMRDYAKLSEQEKPLLVAAVLLALWDPAFHRIYPSLSAEDLPNALWEAMERTIDKAKMDGAKPKQMKVPFHFVTSHEPLQYVQPKRDRSVLQEIVAELATRVHPYISEDIDMLGQFYGEFLRYTGGDKKGLGIVLTPRHVADLFAQLSGVGPQDTVFDPCAGTGGFLLAAMSHMLRQTEDPTEKKRIRRERLVGVEQQPTMFALAAANMMFNGDGKANLRLGSCFDSDITNAIKNPEKPRRQPTIGFVNPPYSQKGENLDELSFIGHMLDCLAVGGTGIAIVPMSCAITPSAGKAALLRKHTLAAVMSMPTELFYPVGTVTCIMVFRAHQPHSESKETWFGYWKDDGFVKTKDRGRVDAGDWPALRDEWVRAYNNRLVEAGKSVSRVVGPEDEWCAEAYMETDYSQVDEDAFKSAVRDHLLCVALTKMELRPAGESSEGAEVSA